jgi:cell division transport system permease protein
VRRTPLLVAATILTVTVSLFLLGAGLLVQKQVNLVRALFYGDVEVSIFLLDEIGEAQRQSLQQELMEHPVVETVIYESKEQAYEHFVEIFADDPVLIESVTPEILPASFRVKLVDPEQYAVIESQFATYPGVDEVSDQSAYLDQVFTIMHVLRNVALAIAVLQLVGAAVLIFNTIRVAAFARREQTGIMKLVGATNWYIRLPFVLEGVLAGLAGGVVAGLLLIGINQVFIGDLREVIPFMPFIRLRDVVAVVPLLALLGGGLAAVASMLSLRRFLAV